MKTHPRPTLPNQTAVDGAVDDPTVDSAVPAAADPGGAHAKGYSADPQQAEAEVPDPVPLVDPPPGAAIIQPERAGHVQPTGRDEPGEYTPNERLMGADR